MQSLQESVRQLQELTKELPLFEIIVLIHWSKVFRQARVVRFGSSFTVLVGGDEQQFPTLDKALEMIAGHGEQNKSKVLLDSLTVRVAATEFLKCDDPIYKLVRSTLACAVPNPRLVSKTLSSSCKILDAFTQQLSRASEFVADVFVKQDDGLYELELTAEVSNGSHTGILVTLTQLPSSYSMVHHRFPDVDCAMATLEFILDGAEILPGTLIVNSKTASDKKKADELLWQETLAFLNSCIGKQEADDKPPADAMGNRNLEIRKVYHTYLASGPRGEEKWNNEREESKRQVNFKNWEVKIQSQCGLRLGDLDFSGTNFSFSTMNSAYTWKTLLTDCNFSNSDLSYSTFKYCTMNDANFSDANLRSCTFEESDLSRANFARANVKGAQFESCNVRGVDFTTFDAGQAKSFKKCQYDETTILPSSDDFFEIHKQLVWKGTGSDPFKARLKKIQDNRDLTNLDFDGFMKMIRQDYDTGRVSKTVSMLKKEKFRLFSEHDASGVFGIVKSQTDDELVYACRLGIDGTFACCTQNLNSCGGLRGALCKHILVLVIGLVKAGELDPKEAAHRIFASNEHKPSKSKDDMTSLFLRYKNAQAGEIDWRPTETIPEDYYSY